MRKGHEELQGISMEGGGDRRSKRSERKEEQRENKMCKKVAEEREE